MKRTHKPHKKSSLACQSCGETFLGRSDARYCSSECRSRRYGPYVCQGCGKEYLGNRPDQTYCSIECSTQVFKRCTICEKSYRGGATSKFCSVECQYENKNRSRRIEWEKPVCKWCEKQIEDGKHTQKYCDESCKVAYQLSIAPPPKERTPLPPRVHQCEGCGKSFINHRKDAKYCSSPCANRSVQRTYQTEDRDCQECGLNFQSERPSQLYCSKRCRRKEDRRVRRARERDAFIEDVSLSELYDKANGYCQICGKLVDMNLRYPDRFSPSVDHRKPLAKGGLHCPENLQLSHLICNIRKSDEYEAEKQQD